jgi:hypothetical protein
MNSISGIGSGTSALQSAELGIRRGLANVDRDAQVVAAESASGAGGGDAMMNALIDAHAQALNVEASARALSIVDSTLGTPIDGKA